MTTVAADSVPFTITTGGSFTTRPMWVPPFEIVVGGTVTIIYPSSSNLEIPLWTVASEGEYQLLVCAIEIPRFVLDIHGFTSIIGTSDLVLPSWIVAAAVPSQWGSGDIVIPTPWVIDIHGSSDILMTSAIVIPSWTLDIVALLNAVGTSGLNIPLWIVNATAPPLSTVNYKTIVMNVSHGGVTEYGRFGFNSMAYINNVLLAAKNDGIYKITGNSDNGQDIDSIVLFGITDLYEKILKSAREAWITMRADGDLSLTVQVDEAEIYQYTIAHKPGVQHAYESRAKIGRGMRNRFVQFGLRNIDGSNFRIESMRIMGDISNVRKR